MVIDLIFSFMEELFKKPFFLILSGFFNIEILTTRFIYINFYSMLHLLSGYGIMFLIYRYIKRTELNFLILFALVILWEVFEQVTIILGYGIFRVDPTIDTLWDVMIGMLGGYLYYLYRRRRKSRSF